jgi:hypothetical protein
VFRIVSARDEKLTDLSMHHSVCSTLHCRGVYDVPRFARVHHGCLFALKDYQIWIRWLVSCIVVIEYCVFQVESMLQVKATASSLNLYGQPRDPEPKAFVPTLRSSIYATRITVGKATTAGNRLALRCSQSEKRIRNTRSRGRLRISPPALPSAVKLP